MYVFPRPDDTPLESVARNNISCIWYPISMLFSPPIIALPSFCDRISRILNSNTCLSPRSVVFVLVLQNPQVSFNSPSISKNRCGQGLRPCPRLVVFVPTSFPRSHEQSSKSTCHVGDLNKIRAMGLDVQYASEWMSRTSHRS